MTRRIYRPGLVVRLSMWALIATIMLIGMVALSVDVAEGPAKLQWRPVLVKVALVAVALYAGVRWANYGAVLDEQQLTLRGLVFTRRIPLADIATVREEPGYDPFSRRAYRAIVIRDAAENKLGELSNFMTLIRGYDDLVAHLQSQTASKLKSQNLAGAC
jgi:hypothetical protein